MTRRALTSAAAILALAVAVPAADGGPAPVKDGRYAGGAKRLIVFFNVSNREIPSARIRSERLAACASSGPLVLGDGTIDAAGRFSLKDSTTHADNTIRVSGRFVSPKSVRGKVKWTTADDCPAGTYDFKYRADRHGPFG